MDATTRSARAIRPLTVIAGLVRHVWGHKRWYIDALAIRAALIYRPWLRSVTFVGVTGSCGKTTTKELIAAVLSNTGRGSKSLGNGNNPRYFAPVILNVRPRDSFCVIEMGVGK